MNCESLESKTNWQLYYDLAVEQLSICFVQKISLIFNYPEQLSSDLCTWYIVRTIRF